MNRLPYSSFYDAEMMNSCQFSYEQIIFNNDPTNSVFFNFAGFDLMDALTLQTPKD